MKLIHNLQHDFPKKNEGGVNPFGTFLKIVLVLPFGFYAITKHVHSFVKLWYCCCQAVAVLSVVNQLLSTTFKETSSSTRVISSKSSKQTLNSCQIVSQLLTRSGSDINWTTETGLGIIARKLRGRTTLQSNAEVLRSSWLGTKCPCLLSLQFPQGQHNVYCRQSFQRILVFFKSRSTCKLCSWLHVLLLTPKSTSAPQEGGNWSASELQPPYWQPSRSWYKLLLVMLTRQQHK